MIWRLEAIVTAAALSGCSFAVSYRAPAQVRQPDQPITCGSPRVFQGLDAVCAGLFVALAAANGRSPDCGDVPYERECRQGRNAALTVDLALAAACAGSAIWAQVNAGRCTELKQWNSLCIRGDETACRHLTPGWTPPPLPAQRDDGPQAGSACAGAHQCAKGLACVDGRCVWPFTPLAPLELMGMKR